MSKVSSLEQIRQRIVCSDYGSIYVASDFNDLASNATVRKSLSRLANDGLIHRVLHGVYVYPEYNSFLQEFVVPSPHLIAQTIARNHGWAIVPEGNTALNLIGLSTQVPAEWVYVSTGPYKTYTYGKITIRFNHTALKDISSVSYKTALVVQALKAIGKDRLDDDVLQRISGLMTDREKAACLSEGKYMTQWVYEALRSSFEKAVSA